MLKNYIIVAFRDLWKSRGYAAINIFGLATAQSSICSREVGLRKVVGSR